MRMSSRFQMNQVFLSPLWWGGAGRTSWHSGCVGLRVCPSALAQIVPLALRLQMGQGLADISYLR